MALPHDTPMEVLTAVMRGDYMFHFVPDDAEGARVHVYLNPADAPAGALRAYHQQPSARFRMRGPRGFTRSPPVPVPRVPDATSETARAWFRANSRGSNTMWLESEFSSLDFDNEDQSLGLRAHFERHGIDENIHETVATVHLARGATMDVTARLHTLDPEGEDDEELFLDVRLMWRAVRRETGPRMRSALAGGY